MRPFARSRAPRARRSPARRTLDKYPVKALSAAGGQALLTVTGNGMLGVPGIAARTFEALHREGISVSLISQSSSEQSICFAVPEAARQARARRGWPRSSATRSAARRSTASRCRTGLATVAVVGHRHGRATPASRRACSRALPTAGINIVAIAQGSSELNISFVVAAKDAAPAQRAVHAAFQLSKIGGGAATRAAHRDAVLLGFGQIGRALAGIIAKERRRSSAASATASASCAWPRRIDTQRFRVRSGRPDRAQPSASCRTASRPGAAWPQARGGRRAKPAEALALLRQHALPNPILVDVTADDTTPLV